MSAKPRITGRATRDWQELDARHYLHPFTDFRALAAEMKKITRTPHTFGEMGVLASESVAAHFEQRLHIAQLEGHYREAMEIAHQSEARAGAERPVVTPQFQQERVPVK